MVAVMAFPAVIAAGLLLVSSPDRPGATGERAPNALLGAGEAPPGAGAPFALRYHPVGDPEMALFLAAAWATTELVSKNVLAPRTCLLCDRDPEGVEQLNAFDLWGRGGRWPSLEAQHTADTVSNVIGFALLPAAVIGIDVALARGSGSTRYAMEDLVLVLKTAAGALVLNQAVKFLAGRERPFVHVLTSQERPNTDNPLDNNVSFFSGHATFAFAATVAASTLAELRGYPGRTWMWAVGLPLAAATAYLRVAADKHYLSDVLLGAAVGTAFGLGVPLLLHPREGRAEGALEINAAPTPGGLSLSGRF